MDWGDLIGKTLGAYTTLEQQKIDARLAASQEQQRAYDLAAQTQQAAKNAVPQWALFGGLALAGLLVFMVVK